MESKLKSILIGFICCPFYLQGYILFLFQSFVVVTKTISPLKESLRTIHVKYNVPRFIVLKGGLRCEIRLGIGFPLSAGSMFQELLVLRLLYTEVLVVSYRPPNQTTLGVQGDKVFLFR